VARFWVVYRAILGVRRPEAVQNLSAEYLDIKMKPVVEQLLPNL
jgi:hypothetical protein